MDNAYWLWSFQGKILKRNQCDKFCQLLWRPRLPTLLPEKKLKEIKKNLKKYSVEFDKVDSIRGSAKTKELLIKRKKMYEEYMAYRKKKDAQVIQRHSTYCHYNRVFLIDPTHFVIGSGLQVRHFEKPQLKKTKKNMNSS